MTFDEAIALQPQWVGIWLNWLLFGAFILPITLIFWKQSRVAGIVTVAASAISAASVMWMYEQLGYVKLLGLPHIIFWLPLCVYLFGQLKKTDMPKWPKRIMIVIMLTLMISLAFDVIDVARYILGERQSFAA